MRGSPDISAADLLLQRADEYAIRQAHQVEIAEAGDVNARAARETALVFATVELVLREIAEVVEQELAA